ncbi:MAG: hypothetical protein H6Q18_427 [Bacteroidetes bacterium]|nr:hypothetical protein [Bacteroidota bacterium]
MRKVLLTLLILCAAFTIQAQNLQVHYDFGKNRKFITTTFEMFKPDKWGNTFAFIDFDYNYGAKKSPSCAYMEIARCLNFWGGPFSAQIEYNGGFGAYNIAPSQYTGGSFAINNAWLVGVDYFLHNKDFSKTFNLKVLAKNIVGINYSPQFTGVWEMQFLNKKVTLSGFADLWWEKNTYANAGSNPNPVFISEPQFWYNFTPNISAGSEVEVSTNFGGNEGFMVNPTLAVKWNF